VSAAKSFNGFIGCNTSHLNVMIKAQAHGEQPLIIEDDIVIHQTKFSLRIGQIMQSLNEVVNWDVFYFYNDGVLSSHYMSQHPNIRSGPSACCHFYAINKAALGRVITLLLRMPNAAIDLQLILLSQHGLINSFCSSDILVSQTRGLGSDIKHRKAKEDLNGIFID